MICQEFEEALCRKKDFFIRFPYTEDEVQEAIDTFEEEYKFQLILFVRRNCVVISLLLAPKARISI